MAFNAGKVFMESPSGQRQWVRQDEVQMFKDANFKVLPVRLRHTTDNGSITERTFMSDAVPQRWQSPPVGSVSEVAPGTESKDTPTAEVFGRNLGPALRETAVAGAPMLAASLVPGAGFVPAAARFGLFTGVGGTANMMNQKANGSEPDPYSAYGGAALSAAMGIPFELLANYMPRIAPRMVSDVMRPTATQQKAMEAVAQRQGAQVQDVDYDRAAKQLLDERGPGGSRVMPNKAGLESLKMLNEGSNATVNDILAKADAAGYTVAPSELVRSPEIAQLRRQLRKEVDGPDRVKALHDRLKKFLAARSTSGTPNIPGTPPAPTGLYDQFGSPIMTAGTPFRPGQPRVQKRFTATKLGAQDQPPNEGEKSVWRRGAASVNKAREMGTMTDKEQALDALVDDALARAAKRRLENTGFTTADPEDTSRNPRQIDVNEANARLERRIPLEDVVREHLRRPPMSFGERIGLIRGKLPFPDAMVLRAAYSATEPGYVGKMIGAGALTSGTANAVLNRGNR